MCACVVSLERVSPQTFVGISLLTYSFVNYSRKFAHKHLYTSYAGIYFVCVYYKFFWMLNIGLLSQLHWRHDKYRITSVCVCQILLIFYCSYVTILDFYKTHVKKFNSSWYGNARYSRNQFLNSNVRIKNKVPPVH